MFAVYLHRDHIVLEHTCAVLRYQDTVQRDLNRVNDGAHRQRDVGFVGCEIEGLALLDVEPALVPFFHIGREGFVHEQALADPARAAASLVPHVLHTVALEPVFVQVVAKLGLVHYGGNHAGLGVVSVTVGEVAFQQFVVHRICDLHVGLDCNEPPVLNKYAFSERAVTVQVPVPYVCILARHIELFVGVLERHAYHVLGVTVSADAELKVLAAHPLLIHLAELDIVQRVVQRI